MYSRLGSKKASDCKLCDAGFYCVLGVHTNYMIDCPKGFYCPKNETDPIACPKGTYNPKTNMWKLDDCQSCPGGT